MERRERESSVDSFAVLASPSAPGKQTRSSDGSSDEPLLEDPELEIKGDEDEQSPERMEDWNPEELLGAMGLEESMTHEVAQQGLAGSAVRLPHLEAVQRSFGPAHDLASIQAFIGGPAAIASEQLNVQAYARGNQVAFAHSPDLRLAAHEAAHVIQQRGGAQLPSNVGAPDDSYEQKADAVAELVVRGESAAALLGDPGSGAGTVSSASVQMMRRQFSPQGASRAISSSLALGPSRARSGSFKPPTSLLSSGGPVLSSNSRSSGCFSSLPKNRSASLSPVPNPLPFTAARDPSRDEIAEEKAWEAKVLRPVQAKVEAILAKYKDQILALIPGANVKYRGSLATGWKGPHKLASNGSALRFDSSPFDCDAFIEIPHTTWKQWGQQKWIERDVLFVDLADFRGSLKGQLETIQNAVALDLGERVPGYKKDRGTGKFDLRLQSPAQSTRQIRNGIAYPTGAMSRAGLPETERNAPQGTAYANNNRVDGRVMPETHRKV